MPVPRASQRLPPLHDPLKVKAKVPHTLFPSASRALMHPIPGSAATRQPPTATCQVGHVRPSVPEEPLPGFARTSSTGFARTSSTPGFTRTSPSSSWAPRGCSRRASRLWWPAGPRWPAVRVVGQLRRLDMQQGVGAGYREVGSRAVSRRQRLRIGSTGGLRVRRHGTGIRGGPQGRAGHPIALSTVACRTGS